MIWTTELREAMRAWRQLERAVQECIVSSCGPICADCPTPCCREEICCETRESAWLRNVRNAGTGTSLKYDARKGWITPQGCALRTGRPTVCYGFFCDSVRRWFDPVREYALTTAGALMNFVGRRALGDRSLIALTENAELARLRPERLMKRIDMAWVVLESCRRTLETGVLSAEDAAILARVASMPARPDRAKSA